MISNTSFKPLSEKEIEELNNTPMYLTNNIKCNMIYDILSVIINMEDNKDIPKYVFRALSLCKDRLSETVVLCLYKNLSKKYYNVIKEDEETKEYLFNALFSESVNNVIEYILTNNEDIIDDNVRRIALLCLSPSSKYYNIILNPSITKKFKKL